LPTTFIGQKIKQRRLFRLFLAGFIDLLYNLKRQDNVADVVGLAVPNKFDFTFVLEEQETIFFRQTLNMKPPRLRDANPPTKGALAPKSTWLQTLKTRKHA
jgi:hypothetical protein